MRKKVNIKTREEILKNFTREFLLEEKRRCEIDRYVTDFRILIHKRPHENHNYLNRLLQDYTTIFLSHERMNVNKMNESDMKYQAARNKESPRKRYVKASKSKENESYLVLKAKTQEFLKKLKEYEQLEQIAFEIFTRHNQNYNAHKIDNVNVMKFKSTDIPLEIPYKKHFRNVYIVNEPQTSNKKSSNSSGNPLKNYTYIKNETSNFLDDNRSYNENERQILFEQYQNNVIIKNYIDNTFSLKKHNETTSPKKGILSKIKNMIGISPDGSQKHKISTPLVSSYILETKNFLLNEKTYANYEFEAYKLFYIKHDEFENPLIEKIKEIAYEGKVNPGDKTLQNTPINKKKIKIRNLVGLKNSKINVKTENPEEKERFETFNVVKCSPPGNTDAMRKINFQFDENIPVKRYQIGEKYESTEETSKLLMEQTEQFLQQQRTYDDNQKEFHDKFYENHSFMSDIKLKAKKESLLDKIRQFLRIGKGAKPKEKAQFFKEITDDFLRNEQYYNDSLNEASVEFNDNFTIPITNTPNIRLKKKFVIESSPKQDKRREKFEISPLKLHQRSRSEDLLLFKTKSKSLERKSPTSFKAFSERLKSIVGIGNRRRTKSRENIVRLTDPVQYFLDYERLNYDIDPEISKKCSSNFDNLKGNTGSIKTKTGKFLSTENILYHDKNEGLTAKPPTGRRSRKRSDEKEKKRRSRTLSPAQKIVSKVRNFIHSDPKKKERENLKYLKAENEKFLLDHKRFNDFQKEESMKRNPEFSGIKLGLQTDGQETERIREKPKLKANDQSLLDNKKFLRDKTKDFLHETKKFHNLDKEPNNLNKTLIFINNKSNSPINSNSILKSNETINKSSFEERTERVIQGTTSSEIKEVKHHKKEDFTKSFEEKSFATNKFESKTTKQVIKRETKITTQRMISETVQKNSTDLKYPKTEEIGGEISGIRKLAMNINSKIEEKQYKTPALDVVDKIEHDIYDDKSKKIHDEEQWESSKQQTEDFLKHHAFPFEKEMKKGEKFDEISAQHSQNRKVDESVSFKRIDINTKKGNRNDTMNIHEENIEKTCKAIDTKAENKVPLGKLENKHELKNENVPTKTASKLKSLIFGKNTKVTDPLREQILRNETHEFLKNLKNYDREEQAALSRQSIIWRTKPLLKQETVKRSISSKVDQNEMNFFIRRQNELFLQDHKNHHENERKDYIGFLGKVGKPEQTIWLASRPKHVKILNKMKNLLSPSSQKRTKINEEIKYEEMRNKTEEFLRKHQYFIHKEEIEQTQSLSPKSIQEDMTPKIISTENAPVETPTKTKETEIKKSKFQKIKSLMKPSARLSKRRNQEVTQEFLDNLKKYESNNAENSIKKINWLIDLKPVPKKRVHTVQNPTEKEEFERLKKLNESFLRNHQDYNNRQLNEHVDFIGKIGKSEHEIWLSARGKPKNENLMTKVKKLLSPQSSNKLTEDDEKNNENLRKITAEFLKKHQYKIHQDEIDVNKIHIPEIENREGKATVHKVIENEKSPTKKGKIQRIKSFLSGGSKTPNKDDYSKTISTDNKEYFMTNEMFLEDHQKYHDKEKTEMKNFLGKYAQPEQEIWILSKSKPEDDNFSVKTKEVISPKYSKQPSNLEKGKVTQELSGEQQKPIHEDEIISEVMPYNNSEHYVNLNKNREQFLRKMQENNLFLNDHQQYHNKERQALNEFFMKSGKPESEIWISTKKKPRNTKNILGKVKSMFSSNQHPKTESKGENELIKSQTDEFLKKQQYLIFKEETQNLKKPVEVLVKKKNQSQNNAIPNYVFSRTQTQSFLNDHQDYHNKQRKYHNEFLDKNGGVEHEIWLSSKPHSESKNLMSKVKKIFTKSQKPNSQNEVNDRLSRNQTEAFLKHHQYLIHEEEIKAVKKPSVTESPMKSSKFTQLEVQNNQDDREKSRFALENTKLFLENHQNYHEKERKHMNEFLAKINKPEAEIWLSSINKPKGKNFLNKVKNIFVRQHKQNSPNEENNRLLWNQTEAFLKHNQYMIYVEEIEALKKSIITESPIKSSKLTQLEAQNNEADRKKFLFALDNTKSFLKDHQHYHVKERKHMNEFLTKFNKTEDEIWLISKNKPKGKNLLNKVKNIFTKQPKQNSLNNENDRLLRNQTETFLKHHQYLIHKEEIEAVKKTPNITECSIKSSKLTQLEVQKNRDDRKKSLLTLDITKLFLKDHQNYHEKDRKHMNEFLAKIKKPEDEIWLSSKDKPRGRNILNKVKNIFTSAHSEQTPDENLHNRLLREQTDIFLKKQQYSIHEEEIQHISTEESISLPKSVPESMSNVMFGTPEKKTVKNDQDSRKKKGTLSKLKSLIKSSPAKTPDSKEADSRLRAQTQEFLDFLKTYSDNEKETNTKHKIIWLGDKITPKITNETLFTVPRVSTDEKHQMHLKLVKDTELFLKNHQDYHNKQRNEDNAFYDKMDKTEIFWLANRKPEKKNILNRVKNMFSTVKSPESTSVFYDDAAAQEAEQNELSRKRLKEFLDMQQYLIHPEERVIKKSIEPKEQTKKKVTFVQSENKRNDSEMHELLLKQTEDFLRNHKNYHDEQWQYCQPFSARKVETTKPKVTKTTPIISNIKSLLHPKPARKDLPQVEKDFFKVMKSESAIFLAKQQYHIHPEEKTELSRIIQRKSDKIENQLSENLGEDSEKYEILVQKTDEFLKDHQNYHETQWNFYKNFIPRNDGIKQKKKPILAKMKSLFSSNHQVKTINQSEKENFSFMKNQSEIFLKKHQGYLIYKDETIQNGNKPMPTPRKIKQLKESPNKDFEQVRRNSILFLQDQKTYHDKERNEHINYATEQVKHQKAPIKPPVREQKSKSKLMTKLKSLVGGSQENLSAERKSRIEDDLIRKQTSEFLISQKCYNDLEADAAYKFSLFKKVPRRISWKTEKTNVKIEDSSMVSSPGEKHVNESHQKQNVRPQYPSQVEKNVMMEDILLAPPPHLRARKPSHLVESEKIDYEFTLVRTKMFVDELKNHHDLLQYETANFTPVAPPRNRTTTSPPKEKKENIVQKIKTLLPNTQTKNRSYDVQKAESPKTTKETKKEKPRKIPKNDKIIMKKIVETNEIPGVENDALIRNQTDLFLKNHQDYHDKERSIHVSHFRDSFQFCSIKEKKPRKGMVSKLKSFVGKDQPKKTNVVQIPTGNETKEFLEQHKQYTNLEKIAEDEFNRNKAKFVISKLDSSPTSYRRNRVQVERELPQNQILISEKSKIQTGPENITEEERKKFAKAKIQTHEFLLNQNEYVNSEMHKHTFEEKSNIRSERTKDLSSVPSLKDCETLNDEEKKKIETLIIERVVSPMSPTKTVFREIRTREDSSPDRRVYILSEGYTIQKDGNKTPENPLPSQNLQTSKIRITTKTSEEVGRLPTIHLQTVNSDGDTNVKKSTVPNSEKFKPEVSSYLNDFILRERANTDKKQGQKKISSNEPTNRNQQASTSFSDDSTIRNDFTIKRTYREMETEPASFVTETRIINNGSNAERYTTSCYFHQVHSPVWYSQSLLVDLEEKKQSIKEKIFYDDKLQPDHWSESYETEISSKKQEMNTCKSEIIIEIQDEPNTHYISLQRQSVPQELETERKSS